MESNETINRKKTVLITFRSSSGYNKEKKLCSLPQDIQTHAIYSSLKFSEFYENTFRSENPYRIKLLNNTIFDCSSLGYVRHIKNIVVRNQGNPFENLFYTMFV